MNYPVTFAEHTTPLPININTRASEAVAKLAWHGFAVHTGLTPEFVDAITDVSQQISIREHCPRDAEDRFASHASAEAWLQKGNETMQAYGRGVFLLLHKGRTDISQLAGYGWTGPESSTQIPEGKVTFAIRMNEAFQGMGAARSFTTLIVAGSAALYGAESIWLEAWGSNCRATSIYERAGFMHHPEATEMAERQSVRHGGLITDIRVYMSYPDELLNE
jgi:ribosomal protein S18 acetylase RimI-like enzyme